MSVAEEDELARLSANLTWLKQLDSSCNEDSAPVEVIHGDAVPVRGSVYISLGRVWGRETIQKLFSRTFSY